MIIVCYSNGIIAVIGYIYAKSKGTLIQLGNRRRSPPCRRCSRGQARDDASDRRTAQRRTRRDIFMAPSPARKVGTVAADNTKNKPADDKTVIYSAAESVARPAQSTPDRMIDPHRRSEGRESKDHQL